MSCDSCAGEYADCLGLIEPNWRSRETDGSGISEEEWWDLFIKVSLCILSQKVRCSNLLIWQGCYSASAPSTIS